MREMSLVFIFFNTVTPTAKIIQTNGHYPMLVASLGRTKIKTQFLISGTALTIQTKI